MLTEQAVLSKLDNYKLGYYCMFIDMGHAYQYLIDSRLNVFKGENDGWAIVAEKLSFSEKAGYIQLDIFYFGNCLINLENHNKQDTNYYSVYPIDLDSLQATTDTFVLNKDAKYWTIRGQQIEITQNKANYADAGIELKEYEENAISIEEAGRLLILKHSNLLRATDLELYKSIPATLKKILVLDEWHHKDFNEIDHPAMTDDHLRSTYEFNKNLIPTQDYIDFESFVSMFRKQEASNLAFNTSQWEHNRPSSYETWQMLAKVIVTGDVSFYKPTMSPNSHWKNWPDSGSL